MKRTVILNAPELVTCAGGKKAGSAMADCGIIRNGGVVIEDGIIVRTGPSSEISPSIRPGDEVLDATGKAVLPGFVDAHTHFVFGGFRAEEFSWRMNGESYMSIMERGGGIRSSVAATRATSFDALYREGLSRLKAMADMGVTTVEGKSGYGLDADTEILQLEVMKALNREGLAEVVSTYMGPHSLPDEYQGRRGAYLRFCTEEVLPRIADCGLAEFADIFCESGVFSVEESEGFLKAAAAKGMKMKIHADEITTLGGAELAARLGCTSADHLLKASDEGIRAMAVSGVVTTLLPATAFSLREPFADVRKMMDAGCIVALASDFNPGSCFTFSVPLIIALACLQMRMSVEEVVTALTINGAAAVGRDHVAGSIEAGKRADILMLRYPSIHYLPYHTGINIVDTVLRAGRTIKKDGVMCNEN